jgi:hypothetical protein
MRGYVRWLSVKSRFARDISRFWRANRATAYTSLGPVMEQRRASPARAMRDEPHREQRAGSRPVSPPLSRLTSPSTATARSDHAPHKLVAGRLVVNKFLHETSCPDSVIGVSPLEHTEAALSRDEIPGRTRSRSHSRPSSACPRAQPVVRLLSPSASPSMPPSATSSLGSRRPSRRRRTSGAARPAPGSPSRASRARRAFGTGNDCGRARRCPSPVRAPKGSILALSVPGSRHWTSADSWRRRTLRLPFRLVTSDVESNEFVLVELRRRP